MSVYLRNDASEQEVASTYSSMILPRLQSTLATLADLDCAYESDLETVASSGVPDAIKQEVIRTLQQRHQDSRAPYVRRLEALHRRAMMAALVLPAVS